LRGDGGVGNGLFSRLTQRKEKKRKDATICCNANSWCALFCLQLQMCH